MKHHLKILCILVSLLFLITALAFAADWAFVITINDIRMFVDKDSVTSPSFQVARVWRKYEFEPPMIYDSKEYPVLQVYSEEDCAGNRFRVLEEIMEFADDTNKKDSYPEAQWESIAPATFNYHLHALVCKQ